MFYCFNYYSYYTYMVATAKAFLTLPLPPIYPQQCITHHSNKPHFNKQQVHSRHALQLRMVSLSYSEDYAAAVYILYPPGHVKRNALESIT